MGFAADGTYTPPNGAENAFAGQTIASATWNAIFTDLSTALTLLGKGPLPVVNAGTLGFFKKTVDFNSANSDNSIAITLPTGVANYTVGNLKIANASASISTATFSLFTAAGATGVTVITSTAITITTALANTANNAMTVAPLTANTITYNVATLFFRVGTPQGSAATADVLITIIPIP